MRTMFAKLEGVGAEVDVEEEGATRRREKRIRRGGWRWSVCRPRAAAAAAVVAEERSQQRWAGGAGGTSE